MKIIALRGDSDCGKSTTLNLVYNLLIKIRGKKSTPKIVLGNPDQNDFECIVTLKDGTTVGFYTMGDYANPTLQAIDYYEEENVDILVLATNTKFVRPLAKITKFNNHIIDKFIAVPKSVATMQAEDDKYCATIISLI